MKLYGRTHWSGLHDVLSWWSIWFRMQGLLLLWKWCNLLEGGRLLFVCHKLDWDLLQWKWVYIERKVSLSWLIERQRERERERESNVGCYVSMCMYVHVYVCLCVRACMRACAFGMCARLPAHPWWVWEKFKDNKKQNCFFSAPIQSVKEEVDIQTRLESNLKLYLVERVFVCDTFSKTVKSNPGNCICQSLRSAAFLCPSGLYAVNGSFCTQCDCQAHTTQK